MKYFILLLNVFLFGCSTFSSKELVTDFMCFDDSGRRGVFTDFEYFDYENNQYYFKKISTDVMVITEATNCVMRTTKENKYEDLKTILKSDVYCQIGLEEIKYRNISLKKIDEFVIVGNADSDLLIFSRTQCYLKEK